MKNYFIFNDVDTRFYKILVGNGSVFATPERDVSDITVPGRDGVLTIDNDRYKNTTINYLCSFPHTFDKFGNLFRNAMLKNTGRYILRDSYNLGKYRMARLSSSLEFERVGGGGQNSQTFEVTFNCDPQFFLDSGDETININENTTITSPTIFTARPKLRIYGNGQCKFTLNGEEITIKNVSSYVDIDSEIFEVFKGVESQNADLIGPFPVLKGGDNTFSSLVNISKIELIPKWWEI